MGKIICKKWAGLLLLSAALAILCGNRADAGQMEMSVHSLVTVTEAAYGYEKADAKSKVLAELPQGQEVLLVKEDEGWGEVLYQGTSMYVQIAYLSELSDEALVKELEELEMARAKEAMEDVRIRNKMRRDRIVGIIIAVLIIGIFAAGIVAVLRPDGEDDAAGGKAARRIQEPDREKAESSLAADTGKEEG